MWEGPQCTVIVAKPHEPCGSGRSAKRWRIFDYWGMAEGGGFEPPIRFPAYTLSKRAPSATRPPLRISLSNAKQVRCSSRRKLTEAARRRNGYDALMRILFYCGMILIGMALVASAAETAAHGLSRTDQGFIIPAYSLWYTFGPKSLLVFQIRVENIAPWLWDPMITSILKLPAWAIFGIPGGVLVWFFHPGRSKQADEDVEEVMGSFKLFDELTRLAREEQPDGEIHGPRDMLPDDLIGEDIAPDAYGPGEFIDGANPFDPDGGGSEQR